MFMDFTDFLNGRGEVVIFSTDERNLFSNNLTYAQLCLAAEDFSQRPFGQQPRCSL